jgi:alpha/beta superfamily hydrolase
MKYSSFLLIIILVCSLGCNKSLTSNPENNEPTKVGEFIDEWTFRVYPYQNFDTGEFRLWVPDNTSDLRAILILLNFDNSNGLGLANSDMWQKYAKKEHLGLLGVHFESLDNGGRHYSDASAGSGSALLKALDAIADKHELQNLKSLPFLVRGYSSGGVFAYSFSRYVPERIVAFANIRGPIVGIFNPSDKESPPGLMLAAENDTPATIDSIIEAVHSERVNGNNWSYAIEPNSDHFGSLAASDKLIKVFFSKALSKRVIDSSDELQTIPEQSGWLGNNETQKVYPFNSYPGSKEEASWLIDEEFSNLWQNYQKE